MNAKRLAKIKKFLKKHPKIDYWQKVLAQSNNENFRGLVRNSLDEFSMQIKHNPDSEVLKDRIVLSIYCPWAGCGLFGLLRFFLERVPLADTFNFLPVVSINEHSLLREQEPINGSENPFEYYFLPPAGIPSAEGNQCANVCNHLMGRPPCGFNASPSYLPDFESERGILARMYTKYIHLRPELESWIDGCVQELLGGRRTLGVQVRATDFRKGYLSHPIFVPSEEYADRAEKWMAEGGFQQIFLATDEQAVVELFQKRFGERCLFYQDTYRSKDDEPIHISQNPRPLHRYQLGREALRDMMTLAASDGLICGYSGITTIARIAKASQGGVFQPLEILGHGVATEGKPCPYDHLFASK